MKCDTKGNVYPTGKCIDISDINLECPKNNCKTSIHGRSKVELDRVQLDEQQNKRTGKDINASLTFKRQKVILGSVDRSNFRDYNFKSILQITTKETLVVFVKMSNT